MHNEMRVRTGVLHGAACILAIAASAPPAVAQDVHVALAGTADKPTVSGANNLAPQEFDIAKGTTIIVDCTKLPCNAPHKVSLKDSATGKTDMVFASTASAANAAFILSPDSQHELADYTFELIYDDHAASPRFKVHGAKKSDTKPQKEAVATDSKPLTELIATSCPEKDFAGHPDFVLRPDGTVIERGTRRLNEGDDVHVIVYGHELLMPKLRVKRESAARVPKLTNIFGANVNFNATGLNLQALNKPQCKPESYVLADFAPGTGVIDISAITDQGYVSTGKVDFVVRSLFTGAFSLGGMHTTVANPTYGYVFNGKDTVVTETGTRNGRLLYVIQYTPFIWGAQDLDVAGTKATIYPMVGLVLNDVPNNGIAGISLSFASRVSFSWGVHAARVTAIDPQSGLGLNSVYSTSRGTTVPTVRYWTIKPFYSVAIDLQAASDLLRSVLGTAGTTK
jgi:hypothetical protein